MQISDLIYIFQHIFNTELIEPNVLTYEVIKNFAYENKFRIKCVLYLHFYIDIDPTLNRGKMCLREMVITWEKQSEREHKENNIRDFAWFCVIQLHLQPHRDIKSTNPYIKKQEKNICSFISVLSVLYSLSYSLSKLKHDSPINYDHHDREKFADPYISD